tara:strand:- start:792 stop:1940 length:1149 start_codon:yes stop_codon:yes gene_type:complete
MINYKNKYLKYKLKLQKLIGGVNRSGEELQSFNISMETYIQKFYDIYSNMINLYQQKEEGNYNILIIFKTYFEGKKYFDQILSLCQMNQSLSSYCREHIDVNQIKELFTNYLSNILINTTKIERHYKKLESSNSTISSTGIREFKKILKISENKFNNLLLNNFNLNSIKLFDIKFEICDILNSRFTYSKLDRFTFTKVKLQKCNIIDTSLQKSSFNQCIIKECEIVDEKCNFYESEFEDCEFKKVNFSDTQMNSVNFKYTKFDQVNFAFVNMQESHFKCSIISNCVGTFYLSNSKFDNLKITNTTFHDESDLDNVTFNDSELDNCFCENCNMENTKFINCNIKNCNFESCNITGLELINCTIENSQFNNCTPSNPAIINSNI